jgi:Zn-dependent membrane protease YugP
MTGYWILIIGIMAVSWWVSSTLKSKFKKYSKEYLSNGLTGAQIAQRMLNDNGIYDVQVISTPGQLTDHYDPRNKTVNLSEAVYNQRNAAAAAVAAHEVGHAIQHAKAYSWLEMRSQLVPLVQIAANYSQWVIMGGLLLYTMVSAGVGQTVLLLGIIMFGLGTLFSFVTLPVEYDASNRALAWLKNQNMVTPSEYAQSEDALKWAARTYVVAAVGSLATLLYFIMIYLGRD